MFVSLRMVPEGQLHPAVQKPSKFNKNESTQIVSEEKDRAAIALPIANAPPLALLV